jgi:hypothetical protein
MSSSGSSSSQDPSSQGRPVKTRRAGAFDMRNFIAALLGIYGVVLVIYGIIGSSDTQLAKSDQVNINLWAGIGMVVVSAVFITWARLRPVIVPEHVEDQDQAPTAH